MILHLRECLLDEFLGCPIVKFIQSALRRNTGFFDHRRDVIFHQFFQLLCRILDLKILQIIQHI